MTRPKPKSEDYMKGSTLIDYETLPKAIQLKLSILTQLLQIYKKAIADGSYIPALKSIELTIKMLPLLETPPSSTPSLADLDVSDLKKIIKELEKEPS